MVITKMVHVHLDFEQNDEHMMVYLTPSNPSCLIIKGNHHHHHHHHDHHPNLANHLFPNGGGNPSIFSGFERGKHGKTENI